MRVGFGLTHGFSGRKHSAEHFRLGKVSSKSPTISAEVNIFRTVKSDADTAVGRNTNDYQLEEYKRDGTSSNYSAARNV